MKKIALSSLIILLIATIIGCSNSKASSPQTNKFTAQAALRIAITHYNKVDKGKLDYKFPLSTTVGKTVSKEVTVGGPAGNKTKLNLKNSIKPSGTNYIVTLTEDFNYIVNGKKAISYWKYEVSPNGIKLLDNNENGSIINEVK